MSDLNREIEAYVGANEKARRLMTVPGIGPWRQRYCWQQPVLVSSSGQRRDMAAWLGLVPREHSTGGKTTMLGISKRGNKYLRRLLVPRRAFLRLAP
jgi:transposase